MSTSAEAQVGPWLAIFSRFPFPAIVVERESTRLIRANRAAHELLGLEEAWPGDSLGPPLADLVTRSLPELVDDLRIAAGGGDLPLVLRPRSDGEEPERHGCQVIPMAPDGSLVDRWLVTFGCNPARLERMQRLGGELRLANEDAAKERQLRRRADRDLETLERFAQAMVHDLKGPLRHIGSLLPAIEDSFGADIPQESRRMMELARISAERGRELVDALLRHAGAASGSVELHPVDLDRTVEASVNAQRWTLDGIAHRVSLEGPLGIVEADRSLIRILIDNLIGNAIKYRHPDRVLEVRITSGANRSGTILEVIDNGIGFEPVETRRIFEPFVRLANTVNGHGIGLATCQTICERHGWRIEADGRPGQGARFTIRTR